MLNLNLKTVIYNLISIRLIKYFMTNSLLISIYFNLQTISIQTLQFKFTPMKTKSAQSKSAKAKHQTPERDPNQMEVSGTTFNRNQVDAEYGQQLAEDSHYLPKTIPGFQLPSQNPPDRNRQQGSGQTRHIETIQNGSSEPQKETNKNGLLSHLSCNFLRQICGSNLCIKQKLTNCQWFTSLDKKKRVAIVVSSVILTIAVIAIAVTFSLIDVGPQPTDQMYLQGLEYNGTIMFVNSMQGRTRNNHTYSAIITKRKIQVPHLTLGSVLKMVTTSDKQEQIHFNIPIQSILQTFSVQHKQQKAYQNWLEDYNKNPQETINKLVQKIKEALSRPGSYKFGKRIADNLTIISVNQKSQIEVEYLPFEQKFGAARFDLEGESPVGPDQNSQTNTKKIEPQNNLKSEVNTQGAQSATNTGTEKNETNQVQKLEANNNDNKESVPNSKDKLTKTPVSDEALMGKVMLETIYYIKRVAARNIEVLRQKREELQKFQSKLIDEQDIEQEWQKVLVEECRTLESQRFRCSLEGAIKLVPGLTLEKIYSDEDLVISETLDLVFKETSQQE